MFASVIYFDTATNGQRLTAKSKFVLSTADTEEIIGEYGKKTYRRVEDERQAITRTLTELAIAYNRNGLAEAECVAGAVGAGVGDAAEDEAPSQDPWSLSWPVYGLPTSGRGSSGAWTTERIVLPTVTRVMGASSGATLLPGENW